VCGDLFQLCPPKKYLAANLTNHVMGIKHVTKVEEAARPGHLSGLAISTGHRERPTTSSRSTLENQNDLHNWFRAATRSEGGLEVVLQVIFFSILSFLYWGNRRPTCIYSNNHMILLVCLWIPCQALIGSLNLIQKEHSCIMINCMLLVGASTIRSIKGFLHLESPLQTLLAESVAIFHRNLILECELFVKMSVWNNGTEEVLV
jgi:hypothetical protein